jgi:hypothetical protein
MKLEEKNINILSNQSGQSFIEFLLLFFILITISFGILSGFNSKIGGQWKAIVQVLAMPNTINSFNL